MHDCQGEEHVRGPHIPEITTPGSRDEEFMKLALSLASSRAGYTSPNPAVGAVVVKDGVVVGRGSHPRAGEPHAEVFALDEAGEMARDATLYVTLEPCCHFGRTPPCTRRIIAAGIKKVVAATVDPNPKVAGKGLEELRQAGIEAEAGLLEQEARALNEAFFKYITTGMPFVTLKMAMSLDGRTAAAGGDSRWITGPEARADVHRLRSEADAVMVGVGTVLKDDPELTVRLAPVKKGQPLRIVVDSRARTPVHARVLGALRDKMPDLAGSNGPGGGTIIATTDLAPKGNLEALAAAGATILAVKATPEGRVGLPDLLAALGRLKIVSVLCEGGAELAGNLARQNLVDKFRFYLAPKIIGGSGAHGVLGGPDIDSMGQAIPVKGLTASQIGPDLVIEGYPQKLQDQPQGQ